ncbi:MAG: hypothetical protein Q9195_008108 [Heterodermia aff. obscurata]
MTDQSSRNASFELETVSQHDLPRTSRRDESQIRSAQVSSSQGGVLRTLSKTLSRASTIDPGPPPDGGLKAWTQALMGHLVVFNTWGYINSFGVFQSYYVNALNETPSAISWVGSVQIFLLFAIGSASGRATDAGYFRAVFVTGSILQLLGIFMTSLSTEYWQLFLSQGICTGIGNGLLFTPALACISTYFSKKRGLALAIAASGNATGGMVFPAVVETLLPKIGFPWTMRALGFLMLGVTSVTLALMKTRLPPRKAGPFLELIGSFGRDVIHLSQADSFNLIIILNGVGFFGRLIPGYVSDRWTGPFNYVIPCAFMTGILLYCWAAITSQDVLTAWAVVYGWFTAGMQGLFAAMVSSLTDDLKKTGVRMGMIFSVTSVALLTGPPLAGALIQRADGRYLAAQIWAGTMILAGSLVLTGARVSKTGFRFIVRM